MAKVLIGIIGRKDKLVSKLDREGNAILYDYMVPLDKEGASYIGLITNSDYAKIDEEILNLCDGILLTGGVEIKDYHIAIIKYAIEHRIPFLGICQGAQALALSTLTGAKLLKLEGQQEQIHAPEMTNNLELFSIRHKVKLDEGSTLYKLFGATIEVNSNHHYAIPTVSEPLKMVGLSDDGLIEAIEHKDSNVFAMGVQWHPENLESMQPLFKEFVDKSLERKRGR